MKYAIRHLALIVGTAMVLGCASVSFRDQASWRIFVDNTRVVRAAKRTYQLGHNAAGGSVVTWNQLATCLPAQWRAECPEGGVIEPGKIGEPMKCSVHGQGLDSNKRRYLKQK